MIHWILAATAFFALHAHASLHDDPADLTDPYYLIAEFAPEDSADVWETEENLDETGWNGQVDQIDPVDLARYASSRIDAVAAVPRIEKSKCRPESGIASWYGGSLNGGPTASGERFNTHTMTAAHKKLPFGTKVRVTNKRNGLSVVVRINDRGPFVRGRVIDVSHAAAKALHLDGIGRVQLSCI